jgi:hypothetical protein
MKPSEFYRTKTKTWMISLYGAGQAGQTFRITEELAKVFGKRNILFTTRKEQLAAIKQVDAQIDAAKSVGADDTVSYLQNFKRQMNDVVERNRQVDNELIREASEIHPDLEDFVRRYTASREGQVNPDFFKRTARIMSEYMAEEAPVTQEYIQFWKRVGQTYAQETNSVDVPWVTFDGKRLFQRYRPDVQHEIRFRDPNTGWYVRNIYSEASDKADLLGKGSIGDVRLGTGVNGTHMNDSSIVRMFHLEGRRRGVPTTTIHD